MKEGWVVEESDSLKEKTVQVSVGPDGSFPKT